VGEQLSDTCCRERRQACSRSPRPLGQSEETASPAWVDTRAQQVVDKLIGRGQPIVATFHIPYPRKVVVVIEFKNVVVCRTCSAPSNALRPHGRVFRFSLDRRTRRTTDGFRFCEVNGASPPLSDCLRR
jgi:hypothetical protein